MSDPGEIAVAVHGLRKSFGGRPVYDGLELEVRRGETLTVAGASGTGKSVLLKLIIGLYKPDAGAILLDGEDVVPLAEPAMRRVRRRVGMLFQGSALFDSMSVGENVAYGLHEHFDWPPDRIAARVAECLSWVGLPDAEKLAPAELSGGMKKRVGLARALAPGPSVILYDEPTTGLDPFNTRRINELIVGLKERLHVTSMVITHDIVAALAVSDRIALLDEGRIALVSEVDEARRSPPERLGAFMRGEGSGT